MVDAGEKDNIVKVSSKTDLKKLTAAIVYKLHEIDDIQVRCIGERSIVNAVKAISKVCSIYREREAETKEFLCFDFRKEDVSNNMGKFVVQIFDIWVEKEE